MSRQSGYVVTPAQLERWARMAECLVPVAADAQTISARQDQTVLELRRSVKG